MKNSPRGTWHKAVKVPGALNKVGPADFFSVSCASAGNCAAGGDYSNFSGQVAFVSNEVNGVWGKVEEVTGAGLGFGLQASTNSVSCASAGNCAAGGYNIIDDQGDSHAFIVTETNGVWGKAKVAAAALDRGDGGTIFSVSCGSSGNCSAGGFYYDKSFRQEAFVVNEVNGTWQTAQEVPGTAALNAGNAASTESVSCGSARSCSAGGYYTDSAGHSQAFVVNRS